MNRDLISFTLWRNSLDLSGEVEVTDAERFTQLLTTGIGPAKAFGCGLMLVRRI